MAKTSGRNVKKTGGFAPRDWNYKGGIENIRGLVTIKHNDVYREIKRGISRFQSTFGVQERSVKLADLESYVNGVQMTYAGSGENAGIYLNAKVFDLTKTQIASRTRNAYKYDKDYGMSWSTKTNAPVQHTVTHELAHATWNSYHKKASAVAAGNEIKKVYSAWLKNVTYRRRHNWGKYSSTNVNEFFAEAVTKHIHGADDSYTNKIVKIVKRFKL